MKFNFFEILIDSENECYYKSPKHIRVAIISGVVLYSLFGFLDLFMLPQSYKYAWIIRFGIVAPVSTIIYLFTYHPKFLKFGRMLLTILVIAAQVGIVAMIYIAHPWEGAYFGYYAGLILVIFWAALIFRLSMPEVIVTSISNVLFYNLLAIVIQRINPTPRNTLEFGYFLNNNFFLISTSFLAVLGAWQINKYKRRLQSHNQLLIADKEELFKAKKKAEESDKLKSAFLANMSHEIRTPMNAILGFGELLRHPNLSKTKRDEYINIIQSKGNQLLHLINDIIDLSKIESNTVVIKSEPFILNQLLDELSISYQRMVSISGPRKPIGLEFVKGLSDSKSYILADVNRLKQILSNLIDNAIKFTHEGEIMVSYELVENKFLQFCVKDSGIGIPPDKQTIIFERFRQVSEDNTLLHYGTGLGLSIVKSLVGLTGGKVWVESEPGLGSQFCFTLPYHPAFNGNHKEPRNQPDVKDIDWRHKTILLAEDDDDNFLFLEELLRVTNVKILRTRDGKETLEMAIASNDIDLILMDVKMPLMSGYEAARQIKQLKSNIPIIAQTAYAMEEDRRNALASSCNEYIAKPIEAQKLFYLIAKYLN